MSTFRVRRIPDDAGVKVAEQLSALATEFADIETGGSLRYGVTLAIFPTTRPGIEEPKA